MTTLKASAGNSESPRRVKKNTKVFGRITSAEGQRTVWKSTVQGRVPSRAIKGDPVIGRSRFDD